MISGKRGARESPVDAIGSQRRIIISIEDENGDINAMRRQLECKDAGRAARAEDTTVFFLLYSYGL